MDCSVPFGLTLDTIDLDFEQRFHYKMKRFLEVYPGKFTVWNIKSKVQEESTHFDTSMWCGVGAMTGNREMNVLWIQ